MSYTTFTMQQLLEAGVHFGHHPRRWNPKMAPYLFGVRNKVHIIDLQQTVPMLYTALEAVKDVISKGGRILFVGTKRQAADKIAEAAKACGQYYVNHRWLGGMLTNWDTVSKSIKRLDELEEKLADGGTGFTKKEHIKLSREKEKLDMTLGGIRSMGGRPNLLFVIDTNKEALAVEEASKLQIPVVGIVDSNSNPDKITYPVPGNDDASRAIDLYCQLIVSAVLEGLQAEVVNSGGDLGEAVDLPLEDLGIILSEPIVSLDAPDLDGSNETSVLEMVAAEAASTDQ